MANKKRNQIHVVLRGGKAAVFRGGAQLTIWTEDIRKAVEHSRTFK